MQNSHIFKKWWPVVAVIAAVLFVIAIMFFDSEEPKKPQISTNVEITEPEPGALHTEDNVVHPDEMPPRDPKDLLRDDEDGPPPTMSPFFDQEKVDPVEDDPAQNSPSQGD